MYALVLLIATALLRCSVTAAQDEGSGVSSCTAPKTVRTDCIDGDMIRLYRFSTTENRCTSYRTCPPLSSSYLTISTSSNVFLTRQACEDNCPATECAHPPVIANGDYYMSRSEDGTVTTHYTCQSSKYILVGSAERTCQYTGSWSGDEPYCERRKVTCGPSPDIDGGSKYFNCDTPGCLVIYSCNYNQGYERVSGKGYRTCGHNGQWINDLPICARIRVMQNESEVSEIEATEGQTNFEVRCIIEPQVPPSALVQWIRDGVKEVNGNTHWLSDKKSLALSFDQVESADAGRYKCIMDLLEKHIERSVEFVVLSPTNKLVTVTKLLSYTSITDSMITLFCVFKSTEKPTVEWFFNGTSIADRNRTVEVFDKTQYHTEINFNVLLIRAPKQEDRGIYYCDANGDNTTRQLFDLRNPSTVQKRSADQKILPTSYSHTEDVPFSSICSNETTDIFVGKFRRQTKHRLADSYVLKVKKHLKSSTLKSSKRNTMLVDTTDNELVPVSFKDLYIFITRTNEQGVHTLSEYYQYSERLEMIIGTVCM